MTWRPFLTDEQLAQRKDARIIDFSIPSFARGMSMRMAERIFADELMTEAEKTQAFLSLPRNRREARQYAKGRGPWGLARKRSG